MSNFKITNLVEIQQSWGESPSDFYIILHCDIVVEGEVGGETFLIKVIGYERLRKLLDNDGTFICTGTVIQNEYSIKHLEQLIKKKFNVLNLKSWNAVDKWVQKYFEWS
ncbi:MAG TPA: hypothetical protein ENJ44_04990 [Oceanospirillales bacterium]|nr:hypothetical protein [Oceanospirillales bacterium]